LQCNSVSNSLMFSLYASNFTQYGDVRPPVHFSVASVADVLPKLARSGLALLHLPEVAQSVTPAELELVKGFAKSGRPIFKGPMRDDQGNVITEMENSDDEPESFYGSNRRQQRELQETDAVLIDLRREFHSVISACNLYTEIRPSLTYNHCHSFHRTRRGGHQ
jgi:hypothetical protein